MNSALHNLVGPGKSLSIEPPDRREIDGLVRSGLSRLRDACHVHLSLESRFDLAYGCERMTTSRAYPNSKLSFRFSRADRAHGLIRNASFDSGACI